MSVGSDLDAHYCEPVRPHFRAMELVVDSTRSRYRGNWWIDIEDDERGWSLPLRWLSPGRAPGGNLRGD